MNEDKRTVRRAQWQLNRRIKRDKCVLKAELLCAITTMVDAKHGQIACRNGR